MVNKNRLLLVVLFLVSFSGLSAQEIIQDSIPASKLGISVNYTMDNYFSSVEPKVVIYLKKNQFEIGPKFTVLNDMNSSNVINGITLSYKYFPHPSSKYLDFFFLGNCSFTNNIRSEQRKYTDNAIVYNSIYNHMESFTTATIGYGFIFKIKQFYIEQSMSLGVGQYTETYKLDVTNLSSANYDNSKNNGYDLVKLIKVGIGYKF